MGEGERMPGGVIAASPADERSIDRSSIDHRSIIDQRTFVGPRIRETTLFYPNFFVEKPFFSSTSIVTSPTRFSAGTLPKPPHPSTQQKKTAKAERNARASCPQPPPQTRRGVSESSHMWETRFYTG
jgi:hypothetical protein